MMDRPRPRLAQAGGMAAFGRAGDKDMPKGSGVPKPLREGAQEAMVDMARRHVAKSRMGMKE